MARTQAQAKQTFRSRPRRRDKPARRPAVTQKEAPAQLKMGTPPQQEIKFKKGYGKATKAADIKKRHQQFLRQQREGKVKVRSIVGRKGRGVKVAAGRLKQFAAMGEMEVIREKSVTSSWVRMIHLVKFRKQPALAVTFRNGFTALYTQSNVRDYEAMSRSASKGKYMWAAIYHGVPRAGSPYISIGF